MAKSVYSDESPSLAPVPTPRFLKLGNVYLSTGHINTVDVTPGTGINLHIHGQLVRSVTDPADVAVVQQWLDASTFAAK